MGTAAKRTTRNIVLKGTVKRGKGGREKVKHEKEEISDNKKNPQCDTTFPSDPGQSRKRPRNKVKKALKVKKELQNELEEDSARHSAAAVAVGSETTLKKKAMLIAEFLDRLYPYPPVPLNHYDTFTLLVAVMLSAQTTDGKVNAVTEELFRRAPDATRLAGLPYEDLLEIIRTVGLAPTKARNIIATAGAIAEKGGVVPSTREGLEELPGVGPKTASVILSQAYKKPAFPVDTHIHRLSLRWGLSRSTNNIIRVEADLKAAFSRERWNVLHLQMIYFGREWCPAQGHHSSLCPVCSWASKPLHTKLPNTVDEIKFPKLNSSPHKRRKGIIWYSDRLHEVQKAPADMKMLLLPAKYFRREDK